MSKKSLKNIRNILKESALDSTAHGLRHIILRDALSIKLVWFLFFLASSGACFYLISKTILEYVSYETVSKTETIIQIPSLFPTVSICNLNPFQTQESDTFVNNILAQNGLLTLATNPSFISTVFLHEMLIFKYFIATNGANPNISDASRKNLTIQLQDMLLSCTFNLITCTFDDFVWYWDELYGNCYSFNSGKNSNGSLIDDKKSTKSGAINGLALELYVGNPISMSSFPISNGAHIIIHNKVF